MVDFLKKTCVFAILLAVFAVTPVVASPATDEADLFGWFDQVLEELVASVEAAADFVLGDSADLPPAAAQSESGNSDDDGTGDDGAPEFGAGADPLG